MESGPRTPLASGTALRDGPIAREISPARPTDPCASGFPGPTQDKSAIKPPSPRQKVAALGCFKIEK